MGRPSNSQRIASVNHRRFQCELERVWVRISSIRFMNKRGIAETIVEWIVQRMYMCAILVAE